MVALPRVVRLPDLAADPIYPGPETSTRSRAGSLRVGHLPESAEVCLRSSPNSRYGPYTNLLAASPIGFQSSPADFAPDPTPTQWKGHRSVERVRSHYPIETRR